MTSRKLLTIATVAAALYAVVLVASASAALHRVQVTLVTGQTLTLTVDVPPGTPIEQVQIPGLPAPVQEIVDLGPVEEATPVPTVPPVEVPEVDEPDVDPTPDATPGNQQGGGGTGGGDGGGNSGGGNGNTQAPSINTGDESAVNRTDGNVRSAAGRARDRVNKAAERVTNPDGTPTPANPTFSLSTPGPGPGRRAELLHRQVPDPALPAPDLPGRRHAVRRALGDPGRDQRDRDRLRAQPERLLGGRRSAGCSSCRRRGAYGVDANGDGVKDPFNPVDAIFAAARYLRAAGAETDIRRAVFAYNHADWYVDSVLMRAQVIGGLPGDLVGSLTGLTQGRFPV